MIFNLLADLVLLLHALFILFVVVGVFFVIKWPWLAFFHVPCVIWAVLLELNHWICPLTHLENHFRSRAGRGEYTGGFIEHYLEAFIYPDWLTPERQILLGVVVAAINLLGYSIIYLHLRSLSRNRMD